MSGDGRKDPDDDEATLEVDAARMERLYEDSIGPLLQRYYAELVAQPLPKDIVNLWEKLEQLEEDNASSASDQKPPEQDNGGV